MEDSGTLDDPTITTILIDGASIDVSSGGFTGSITAGTGPVVIEATDDAGNLTVRTITLSP